MINISTYLEKFGEYSNLTDKYLKIIFPEDFERKIFMLHGDKLTIRERMKNYKNLEPSFKILKKIFKERIKIFNKSARSLGYKNHLEYFLALNLVSKEDFESFLKKIDVLINFINNDYINIKSNRQIKDWSILSIPSPEGIVNIKNSFKVPNEIIDIISKDDMRMLAFSHKINIKFDDGKEFGSGTSYNKEKGVVEIILDKKLKDSKYLNSSLIFIHELGHALDYFNCIIKKILPYNLPVYLQESSAEEFTFKFIKKHIPEKTQKIIRYNLLHTLACTLFEIEIFKNDKQNFDKAYAKAINRCYLKANQTKNPLYIFNKRFIFQPLGMLIPNIIKADLYLKDFKSKKII